MQMVSQETTRHMAEAREEAQDVGFILIPGFALMCFASAVEPLRAANILSGRELYRIRVFSPTGEAARSSGGALVPATPLPSRADRLHSVFVVAGGHPSGWRWPEVGASLRALDRDGVVIGGISGGPYVLAEAGLLNHHRFTIHWEHTPALAEAFPELKPEHARYVLDKNLLTCGGGVAPLDMMHALIAARHGHGLATRVSDWYLHTGVGGAEAAQRASLSVRHGLRHPALLTILERMEATIERPLDRASMARLAGITPRHLDRLFATHLGSTFITEYRRLRLEHAQKLLQQSALSISEIAFACGFSSPGHLTRRYREHFGVTPGRTRKGG